MFSRFNMTKVVLLLVAVTVGCLAIGSAILIATGGVVRSGGVGLTEVNQEKSVSLTDINDIKIESVSTMVNVVPINDGELRAHLHGGISSTREDYIPELVAVVNGSSVSIKLTWPPGGVIGYFSSNLKLDVFIPLSYVENLEIKTSSAKIIIEGYTLKRFAASTISGEIRASNIDANEVLINTSSGNARLKNIDCAELSQRSISGDLSAEEVTAGFTKLDTSSGTLTLKSMHTTSTEVKSISGALNTQDFESKQTAIKSSSGKITLNGNPGDVTGESVAGDITLVYSQFANNVNLSTSSGSVRIEIPKTSELRLDYSTSSGKLTNDLPMAYNNVGQRNISGSIGSNDKLVKVSTISGDLRIVGK